ncbi:MAG: PepSY domain-containing protein [Erythrobacter sp.]|nr:PepSY domain-containing protein [Erythrobacter sp.]
MNKRLKTFITILAGVTGISVAQPALADGDVVCGGGPRENWSSLREVRRAAWLERWEIIDVRIEGDCYEVYARTEQGHAIEAFFHPVTLEKLVVFRRGREIFRRQGFTG